MAISPTPLDHIPRQVQGVVAELDGHGIRAVLVSGIADLEAPTATPALALLDLGPLRGNELGECAVLCAELRLPAIALVPERFASGLDSSLGIDDFVLMPPRPGELLARARWVIGRRGTDAGSDIVRAGDLAINTVNFEVSLSGTRLSLRYKEYELLLMMASNPGKVFSRQALLHQIWGYDYLGGTRTVDVHVRRLRSKIEDSEHLFIETVRQVGYRFRELDAGA